MKKSFLLIITLATLFACNENKATKSSEEKTTPDTAIPEVSVKEASNNILTFEESSYDFGKTKQGSIVQHVYSFVNTSDQVVKIQKANASCGCTVPVWPKDPITPNGVGTIEVEFNSAGKSGQQQKTIRVYTDASENPIQLKLTGIVEVE